MPTVPPSRDQLVTHALRHLAGASLVVLAAVLTHHTQYVLISAALLAPSLVDLVALRDHDRRRKLRVTSRPQLVLLLSALLLGGSAVALIVSGDPYVPTLAALSAAAGLGIASLPMSIAFVPAA